MVRYFKFKNRYMPRNIRDKETGKFRANSFLKKDIPRQPVFKTGFTLVELLVAMGLFLILLGIATGGFVKALRSQKEIVNLMEVNDNVSLILEQMAREIRTGFDFSKPFDAELRFINANDVVVFYRLNNGVIEKGIGDVPATIYKQITADNVKINNFNITLLGNEPNDNFPPRITISLSVSPKSGYFKDAPVVKIQTTISSRILE